MINLASFNVDGSYKDAGLKSYNGNYTQEKILKPFDLVLCNTQQTAIEFSKDIIGKAFLIPDIFDGVNAMFCSFAILIVFYIKLLFVCSFV